jgi:hypothetical protein
MSPPMAVDKSDATTDVVKKRPIQKQESDFGKRLLETIGDEPVAAFGRRCGTSESLLRGYLNYGNKPGIDHLVAMADAGNVSIEWLASGRGSKQRRSAAQSASAPTQPQDAIHSVAASASSARASATFNPQNTSDLLERAIAIAKSLPPKASHSLATRWVNQAEDAQQLHDLRQTITQMQAAQKNNTPII